MILLFILLLTLLLLFSASLAATEAALFSLSPFSVRGYRLSQNPKERIIATLLKSPRELLVTLLMLNIFSNILVQNTVSTLFDSPSFVVSVGIPLALTLVFGELLPKCFALSYNRRFSYFIAPTIYRLFRFVEPVRKFFTVATEYLAQLFFFFLKKEEEISVDELYYLIGKSLEKGILNRDEYELMKGYLHLRSSTVKELMRPREEIIFYDLEEPLESLVRKFVEKKCSRMPVCEKDLQDLKGVISIGRFFFLQKSLTNKEDLIKELKKPFFVPETKNGWDLFQDLRARDEELAIVVDEYGSISGLIAQEDLIESVVGEIIDPRDSNPLYISSGSDVLIANGKLEIDELERIFQISLPRKSSAVTIAGWLIDQLGEIPKTGEKYECHPLWFHVLAAEPNRVMRIYIRRLGKQEGPFGSLEKDATLEKRGR